MKKSLDALELQQQRTQKKAWQNYQPRWNSGIGVGLGESVGVGVDVGVVGACGLGAVKKGTKLTIPKLKSFLKS